MSTLVQVHVLDVVTRGESAVLALRWQATGPRGGQFPALDADIWLTPPGSAPPGCRWPGSTGPRSVPWARAWTGRSYTGWPTRRHGPCWPAWRMLSPVPRTRPAPCGNRHGRQRRPPDRARNALARRPAAGRIRLPVIEYDIPDVPDRQVQLAEGFADLARGPAVAVEQPQRRFQDSVPLPVLSSSAIAPLRMVSTEPVGSAKPLRPGGPDMAPDPAKLRFRLDKALARGGRLGDQRARGAPYGITGIPLIRRRRLRCLLRE